MMDLIEAMSDEELDRAIGLYKDNPKVMELLNGIITGRATEAEQAKLTAKFSKGIEKLFATLAHPEGIMNVYACWAEVEVEDTEAGQAEEVEVVDTPAITDKDGKVTTPAVMVTELRYPKVKQYQWVVKVNHAERVARGDTGKATTSKRAITVKKIVGDRLEVVGNFVSATKACEHLNLIVGSDSAMRVLTVRNPYVALPYEGRDYTS